MEPYSSNTKYIVTQNYIGSLASGGYFSIFNFDEMIFKPNVWFGIIIDNVAIGNANNPLGKTHFLNYNRDLQSFIVRK